MIFVFFQGKAQQQWWDQEGSPFTGNACECVTAGPRRGEVTGDGGHAGALETASLQSVLSDKLCFWGEGWGRGVAGSGKRRSRGGRSLHTETGWGSRPPSAVTLSG